MEQYTACIHSDLHNVCLLYWLCQVKGSIPMKPHPDEVDAVKWVSLDEMDTMMADTGTDLGTPDYTRADSDEIAVTRRALRFYWTMQSPLCMLSATTH